MTIRATRLFTSLLMLMLIAALCVADAFAGEQGWVLIQNPQMLGEHEVFITPSAVKMVNKKDGYTVLMKAPSWNVILFSDRRKAIYETDISHWHTQFGFGLTTMSKVRFERFNRAEGGSKIVQSVRCHRTVFTDPQANPKHRTAERQQLFAKDGELLSTQDFAVPQQVAIAMQKLYGLPAIGGIPIMMKSANWKGNPETVLETSRISKTLLERSVFNAPKGYRKVASETEVVMDSSKEDMIKDMVGDL